MRATSAGLAVRAGAAAACLAAVVAAGPTLAAAGGAPAAPAGVANTPPPPPPIQIGTSYMPVPQSAGTTVAYVVIRNNGAADRLGGAPTPPGGAGAGPAPRP